MKSEIDKALRTVRAATHRLAGADDQKRTEVIRELALRVRKSTSELLSSNRRDLDRMDPTDPKYDRLLLNEARIESIAADLEAVAGLPTAIGSVIEERSLDNGLHLSKVRVPLGVVAVIFESRPNVTFDVFALCLKSGNACVLKGSRDAADSNEVIVGLMHDALAACGMPQELVYLAPVSYTHLTLPTIYSV